MATVAPASASTPWARAAVARTGTIGMICYDCAMSTCNGNIVPVVIGGASLGIGALGAHGQSAGGDNNILGAGGQGTSGRCSSDNDVMATGKGGGILCVGGGILTTGSSDSLGAGGGCGLDRFVIRNLPVK
jgi:hypothetical protein